MAKPVIIICSINGIGNQPNAPKSPEAIAAESIACFDAGAAIIHSHIDLGNTTGAEAAARYLEGWLPALDARPDGLFYPTANFSPTGLNYDHLPYLADCDRVRLGLADVGPLQLGTLEDGTPRGAMLIPNSYDEVAERLEICRARRLGVSLQIFDPSGLQTTLHWWRAGRMPQGAFINLYFYPAPSGPPPWRAHYSLPPSEKALAAYLEVLGDCSLPWAASVIGGDMAANDFGEAVLRAGGHLNIGLEPYRGERATTNLELIAEAVEMCRAAGRPVATSAEAAQMLDLPDRQGAWARSAA